MSIVSNALKIDGTVLICQFTIDIKFVISFDVQFVYTIILEVHKLRYNYTGLGGEVSYCYNSIFCAICTG